MRRLRIDARLAAAAGLLIVALALRIYHLASMPPELVGDELDLYDSVHRIATTGRDLDGSLMPYLWSPFTRNPPMYALAEFVTSLAFGNGPYGLRLPAALFGVATVGWMYLIGYELTGRRRAGFVAAALTATQPIFVHFSHVAWEPASELPFLLGGIYFELAAYRYFDRTGACDGPFVRYLGFAAIAFGLTSYTYMAGWFYAAALGAALAFLAFRRRHPARAVVTLAAAALVAVAIAAPALAMWFGDAVTYDRTRRIATFAHGVDAESLTVFVRNYFSHFTWSYLVTTGDPTPAITWRYLVGFGCFYDWVVLLAVLGALLLKRSLRYAWAPWFVLAWLAIYPLGGALTNEGSPNAPRTLAGAPVFCLLAAFGAIGLDDFANFALHGRVRGIAVLRAAGAIVLAMSTATFASTYFNSYPDLFPQAWDSGTRTTYAAIRDRASGYDRVCFSLRAASYELGSFDEYYLRDLPLREIDGIGKPACYLRGTLLVVDPDDAVSRPGFTNVAAVLERGGLPFSKLLARPR